MGSRSRMWLAIAVFVVALAVLIGLVVLIRDTPNGTPGTTATTVAVETTVGTDGDTIVGSGSVVTESRNVGPFTTVVIEGEGDVVINRSDVPAVTLTTDDNVLSAITTEVRDATLFLSLVPGVRDVDPTDGVRLEVSVPELAGVGITGAGSITAVVVTADRFVIMMAGAGAIDVSGLAATTLVVNSAGSGLITTAGMVASQELSITGTALYDGGDLLSDTATVDSNSVSSVIVWATDTLDVTLRGIGNVEYWGSPQVTSDISGSGAIRELGEK